MTCAALGSRLADQSLCSGKIAVLLTGKAGELDAAECDFTLPEGRLDDLRFVSFRRLSNTTQHHGANDERKDRREPVSNSCQHSIISPACGQFTACQLSRTASARTLRADWRSWP